VVGFAQDDTGVDVELSDETSLRAEYLVGCDGGRSLIRKAAGIDFPGLDPSTSWMIAEVEMDEEPEIGVRPEGGGIGPVNRVEGGAVRRRAERTADRPTPRAARIFVKRSPSPTEPTSACTAHLDLRFTD
jgi:2-polyprenyl-6-methoxyphenol hydroxylase-like FAD-dependent oxidoreductase